MEVLTLLMLLAKSVLMPFQEQFEGLCDSRGTSSIDPQSGLEKPTRKRNRRSPSHTFPPGCHCPQPAI